MVAQVVILERAQQSRARLGVVRHPVDGLVDHVAEHHAAEVAAHLGAGPRQQHLHPGQVVRREVKDEHLVKTVERRVYCEFSGEKRR